MRGNKSESEVIRLTLPSTEPGKKIRASVLVRNFTKETISFERATSSCKCTETKVPKTSVPPNGSELLEFVFETPKVATKLVERFSSTIYTKGARSTFIFDFPCELSDVVSLVRIEGVYTYSESSRQQRLRIPLLLSGDVVAKELKLVADDNLQLQDGKIISNDDNSYAEFAFQSRLLDRKTETGEIRIERNGKQVASQLVTMKFNASVRVLPDKTVFNVGENEEIAREATAFIKIADVGKGKDDLTIREISARVGENIPLRCSLTELSPGTYRAHLSTAKPMMIEKSDTVKWRIVKMSGEVVELQTDCSLTN